MVSDICKIIGQLFIRRYYTDQNEQTMVTSQGQKIETGNNQEWRASQALDLQVNPITAENPIIFLICRCSTLGCGQANKHHAFPVSLKTYSTSGQERRRIMEPGTALQKQEKVDQVQKTIGLSKITINIVYRMFIANTLSLVLHFHFVFDDIW
ncbi:hypothetical protein MJT46_012634 [Ovis ammon polii x Ovis aries]|nr:hypothetical protein MJT46_012634 [Ovis ammon polii x Ovis aries]